ncbi:helix-turn-helix domain-containing protein [Sulfitobacter sp. R86518]|uniref:helix-turn-helix domain-containing protein n=1 Tax=Sulfitobacter sp. R86518 TaxID=3093858 RepID=UPI0036D7FD4D
MTKAPKTPANIQVYEDILGTDGAVEFLLTFGGAELYMPTDPKGGSKVAQLVGIEKARALADASHAMKARIPTAKRWIAQVLKSKGLPVAEIARKLHMTDVTVRKYLADEFTSEETFSKQMKLF